MWTKSQTNMENCLILHKSSRISTAKVAFYLVLLLVVCYFANKFDSNKVYTCAKEILIRCKIWSDKALFPSLSPKAMPNATAWLVVPESTSRYPSRSAQAVVLQVVRLPCRWSNGFTWHKAQATARVHAISLDPTRVLRFCRNEENLHDRERKRGPERVQSVVRPFE
jgi:hypothetical protein